MKDNFGKKTIGQVVVARNVNTLFLQNSSQSMFACESHHITVSVCVLEEVVYYKINQIKQSDFPHKE